MQQIPRIGQQKGFALLPTAVMLMVLTLLVVASLQSATVLEKMTGNERDRMVAVQAAEAALRDAERDIEGRLANGNTANPNCGNDNVCRSTDASPRFGAADFFTIKEPGTCDLGICWLQVGSNAATYFATPVWSNPQFSNKYATYGQFTGATPIPAVAAQPVYWYEVLNATNQGSVSKSDVVIYRITVRAVGRSAGTVTYVQSIYDPNT